LYAARHGNAKNCRISITTGDPALPGQITDSVKVFLEKSGRQKAKGADGAVAPEQPTCLPTEGPEESIPKRNGTGLESRKEVEFMLMETINATCNKESGRCLKYFNTKITTPRVKGNPYRLIVQYGWVINKEYEVKEMDFPLSTDSREAAEQFKTWADEYLETRCRRYAAGQRQAPSSIADVPDVTPHDGSEHDKSP
jgi:hypothetical protein